MVAIPVSRERVGWALVGVACLAILAVVVYTYVGTFLFGLFLYYAVRPINTRLRRVIRSRTLSAFVSMFLLALPLVLITAYAMAVAIQDLSRFFRAWQVNDYVLTRLQPFFELTTGIVNPQAIISGRADLELLLGSLDVLLQSLSFVGLWALHLFVMLAIAFYLLRDGHRIARLFESYVGNETALRFAWAVDRDLRNVYFGNIANAALTGVIGAIAYEVLNAYSPAVTGIPYPSIVGLLTGAASLVPAIGIKLVWVPMALYVAARDVLNGHLGALWFLALFVVVSLVVVDVLPDLVLRPYVSGRGIHKGALMVTYILGALLFGWPGIFLAPLLLVVVTEFVHVVLPVIAGEGPEPAPIPGDAVEATDGDDVTDVSGARDEVGTD